MKDKLKASEDVVVAKADKEVKKKPEKYEIEDAANTLMRAEEIKKDKHLMPHVHAHLNKKVKAIRSIADIKEARNQMALNDNDEDD